MGIDMNLVDAQLERAGVAPRRPCSTIAYTNGPRAWICAMCGRAWSMCNCSGGTTDVHRRDVWGFWDNDEDSVYDTI